MSIQPLSIPILDVNSLGNSLFECLTIDTHDFSSKRRNTGSPTLIQLGIICICLRGSAHLRINNQEYDFRKGDMLTLLPNSIILDSNSSDDFLGYAIATNTKVLMGIQMADVVKSYVNISNNPIIPITDEQIQTVIELCEMLKNKRSKKDHPFEKEISKSLLAVLCYEISSFYQLQNNEDTPTRSRQSALFHEFLSLVDKYATERRDIAFYANKLCITPKYLSVVIKKSSGYSPAEWINRTVMLYAKTLLASSDMTIQQIAVELNFPNPSFFGQYFKRHEGITPKRYRTSNRT